MMSLENCGNLVSELDNLGCWADDSGFKVARPNSMNRYGMVLNDVGFQEVAHQIMQKIIQPICEATFPALFKSFGSDDASRSLASQHCFIVRYKQHEDQDLKTHRDDADVTLN